VQRLGVITGTQSNERTSGRMASATDGNVKPMTTTTPRGLPRYRLLTGLDDDAFCHRVSDALELGYELYGSPAITHVDDKTMVAQALIWPSAERHIRNPIAGDACPALDQQLERAEAAARLDEPV
jgi:hypothetical protein